MTTPQFPVPIVLLIFNRPDHTRQTFAQVQALKPAKLYIVADGPRTEAEAERCQQVREIAAQIDWPCEVKHNYAEQNMGLKARISSGLNWVFKQEERAIILEDDCVPDPSFFPFCAAMLDRYADNAQVMHISGDNFGYAPRGEASYYFSHYVHVWGWATWRRAWQHFDLDLTFWRDPAQRQVALSRLKMRPMRSYFSRIFQKCYDGEIKTWDYPWMASCLLHNGLCVMPRHNLVTNIGAGEDSTNTRNTRTFFAGRPLHTMPFPLNHPASVALDDRGDRHIGVRFLIENTKMGHILSRILNLFDVNLIKRMS